MSLTELYFPPEKLQDVQDVSERHQEKMEDEL